MKRLTTNLILTALLLQLCQSRPASIPFPIRSLISPDAVVAKQKRKLQLPRFARRNADGSPKQQTEKDEASDGNSTDDDRSKNEAQPVTDEASSEKATDAASDSPNTVADESTSSSESNEADKEESDSHDAQPEPQPMNSTRQAIFFMPPPHQHNQMRPAFPPQPYYNMPHQSPPHRHNKKKPSLLSSILSAFIPRPSPPYPPHPYHNNPTPQNNEVGTTLLSLLLRLTLLSLTTHLLDLLGLGSNENHAFLPAPAQHYTFERVNDRYKRDGNALSLALNSPPPGHGRGYKWRRAWRNKKKTVLDSLSTQNQLQLHDDGTSNSVEVATLDNGLLYNKTLIILDIKPDARVGNGMAEHLRDTVSFIIEQHRDHVDTRRNGSHGRSIKGIRSALGSNLEVLLLLDSPGGTVSDYGLASSHLSRLRNEPHITLSICIDRIAASGGYMMACQATPGHLYAAPFAMVGSIGVLMETVNFNDILNKYGVKPLTIKAGRHKAPLKSLGEVTEEEMEYAQRDADLIHEAFQRHVLDARPNVVATREWMEKVCTGSVFLGREAVELGLIDEVKTSDEYVAERIAAGDRVLRLIPYRGPQFGVFKLSPLDLLLSGMDAEGRARIRQVVRCSWGAVASLCRVGGAVGILNAVHHLAMGGLRSGCLA